MTLVDVMLTGLGEHRLDTRQSEEQAPFKGEILV